MSYRDLLDRMSSNDTEAFLEMTDRYGWSVYSAIREKHPDQAAADRIYNETMNGFYHSLSNPAAEDPLEALLCAFADRVSAEQLSATRSATGLENAPPRIQLDQQTWHSGTPARKKKGFWYGLGILLVLSAIAVVLWCIAGLLMDMNLIPFYDLGYSWFNAHVMEFF